jgi:uncharacterized membrane protein
MNWHIRQLWLALAVAALLLLVATIAVGIHAGALQ